MINVNIPIDHLLAPLIYPFSLISTIFFNLIILFTGQYNLHHCNFIILIFRNHNLTIDHEQIILIFVYVTLPILTYAQVQPDSVESGQKTQLYTISKPEDLNIKGQIDAAHHYKRYKAAATGTLVTSLLSPVIGLIPAILCSATYPKIENLGYPSEELFRQATYHKAYTRKAKKIKQRKVWSNWGIGLGVNLTLLLILSN